MTRNWQAQQERASRFWLRVIVWLATHLPRRWVRIFLYPTVAYFLVTSRDARQASRQYLSRTLGHAPSLSDHWRHFFAFASCTLDRILFLSNRVRDIDIEVHRPEAVRALVARQPGCLLFVAHFGSAESLRVIAINRRALPLSILLDRKVGAMLTELLEKLNPEMARSVIDASERGPALVLKLKEALENERMIGIMADRALPTERSIEVDFLGGKARFPVGPWLLANALQVPIILGFGCYLGDNRYAAHFELFAEKIRLPREDREGAIKHYVQRYAKRLEYYTHLAPYNWFNFYDFWPTEPPVEAPTSNELAKTNAAQEPSNRRATRSSLP